MEDAEIDGSSPQSGSTDDRSSVEEIDISVKFSPEGFAGPISVPSDGNLYSLVLECEERWPDYDWNLCKVMVEPRFRQPGVKGLLTPKDDYPFELSRLGQATIKLLAQKRSDIQSLHAASAAAREQQARRAAFLARTRAGNRRTRAMRAGRPRNPADAQYTFATVRPLSYLPRPERSQAFLVRLRDDPGVRAAMRKHKFSVGLLTEMDPSSNTQESPEGTSRVLGLNRNRGEVIELRLRTDAYDGYRDYNTIRKTLCHELAHNIHGPHDRNFWDLCHQIEREVATADWRSGGQSVSGQEFAPERSGETEEEAMDHGGWTGGEYVLGAGTNQSGGGGDGVPLSRREILAKAAEERARNARGPNQSDGAGRQERGGSS